MQPMASHCKVQRVRVQECVHVNMLLRVITHAQWVCTGHM